MRGAVLKTGAGVLGSGTHPAAAEGDAEITDKARYERILFLFGDAAVTPVAGLHMHVGMPDSQTAIRVFNGLRRTCRCCWPWGRTRRSVTAATPASPHRARSRCAAGRAAGCRGRCGTSTTSAPRRPAHRAADVPDYTWFWWKLRPHPRLGTVEIRALDAQTTVADTAALVALVHCLARDCAERDGGPDLPVELLDEAVFRAARFGTAALLPDARAHHRPVAELLDVALDVARPHAAELRCTAELDAVPRLFAHGGGAGRQREIHEIAGMGALLRDLAALTAAAAVDPSA